MKDLYIPKAPAFTLLCLVSSHLGHSGLSTAKVYSRILFGTVYRNSSVLQCRIEKHHEERYRALLRNVETAKVFEKSEVTIWECRNCGHIVVGVKAPDICPVCDHPQSYFEVRKENY